MISYALSLTYMFLLYSSAGKWMLFTMTRSLPFHLQHGMGICGHAEGGRGEWAGGVNQIYFWGIQRRSGVEVIPGGRDDQDLPFPWGNLGGTRPSQVAARQLPLAVG